MTQVFSTLQFAITPIKGDMDMSLISGSGVLSGIVSKNQATAIYPGQRVTLDTSAVNGGGLPSWVAVAVGNSGIGVVVRNTKKTGALYSAYDIIEVVLDVPFTGIQWHEAAAAFACGTQLEVASASDITVQTRSASKAIGIALDGASAAGDLVRVILTQTAIA